MIKFLFLPLFLFTFCCPAQQVSVTHPLVLSNISEKNGLSDDHVQCVLKDKEGFVWVGTADGLNRMDGSAIKIFRHIDHDTNSLIGNSIYSLTEDREGNIWVGTGEGLSCYQKTRQTFISARPAYSPYGASIIINAICADERSRIWCSTDGGLLSYNAITKKFTPYYNLNNVAQTNVAHSNKLHYMMADSRHELWLCTADGLWTFNPQTLQFKKEIHKNNDAAYNELFLYVFEDHNKNIWAGNWQYGLKRLDRNTGQVTNFLSLPHHPEIVHCINEVKEPGGNYVLWLDGNLLAFDPSANSFFQYPKSLQTVEYPSVSPSFRSADGWMWLTGDKGLFFYSPQQQIFHHLYFRSPVTSQNVVFNEWNNLLLVGAEAGSFLNTYDEQWKIKKSFTPFSQTGYPSRPPAVLSIAKENENIFWVGNSEGILSINLSTSQKKWFSHKDGDSTSLPRNFIAHLFFTSGKQLWIFPWREGIWQMDTLTGHCKRLWEGFTKVPAGIKRLLIADAVQDDDGNIWMADLDEGIILYDSKTKKFSKPFIKELGEANLTSRIFLKNGYCYSFTPSSIFKWSPQQRHLHFFLPPPEMRKNFYDMAPDKAGNWWLASKSGLIAFNEKQNLFKRYTTQDGLVDNDIDGTLYCRNDGIMLLGTRNYFTFFNPADLLAVSQPATRVRLTEVLVNEKRVTVADGSVSLDLDHLSTNIAFHWALPDYANPLRNQYYCRLQRIDSSWRSTGNSGEVQYANLSPGHYSIQLKAASSNGVESSNILTIPFTIHPPFWKTTWFRLLVILFISILFFTLVRYISQRNLKEKLLKLEKEQAVEKERNRISQDMHDDLGSGLTKIAIMSEVVKKQLHEPEKARQQLENIASSSRELVDNLQDIIWVLNPKNDTLENLASYIREYASKFFEPFGVMPGFTYPEKFPAIKLSEEKRRNIFLAVKESFANTCKHAWCNNVHVTIQQRDNGLAIMIEDDGKGFDTSRTRLFGNGLVNMRSRIEQSGGTYTIISSPGNGTKTTIEIPL